MNCRSTMMLLNQNDVPEFRGILVIEVSVVVHVAVEHEVIAGLMPLSDAGELVVAFVILKILFRSQILDLFHGLVIVVGGDSDFFDSFVAAGWLSSDGLAVALNVLRHLRVMILEHKNKLLKDLVKKI